jgi:hypothetical protein
MLSLPMAPIPPGMSIALESYALFPAQPAVPLIVNPESPNFYVQNALSQAVS